VYDCAVGASDGAGRAMATDKTIEGRIIAIQEGRFRLLTVDGRGFLFTLAHNANIDTLTLLEWHERDRFVRVTYRGEPGLQSCVARAVRPVALPAES
jgi:hypothetical protein